jgi:hypothetical protein
VIVVRVLFAVLGWPFVYVADRMRGLDPPASFRSGLSWALHCGGTDGPA